MQYRSLRHISLLIIAIVVSTLSSIAQQQSSELRQIRGTVLMTGDRTPVPYANVHAISQHGGKPDTLSQVSDHVGSFVIALEKGREYRFVATFIGMTCQEVTIRPEEYDEDRRVELLMQESATELDEVTVVAARPLFKVDIDRISYSVQDDPSAQTATLLDMLRKVPLVTVDGQDKIQVKGSSSFKIYLNGKPSMMMDQDPAMIFRSIPASMVQDIEVITDPGVKYDAEGVGAILNIVTESKQEVEGLAGSVNLGGSYTNKKVGAGGGITLTGKKGKFGFSGNYNFNYQPGTDQAAEYTRYSEAMIIHTDQHSPTTSRVHVGNLSASYDITPRDLLSATLSLLRATSSSSITNDIHEFAPTDTEMKHPMVSSRNDHDIKALYSTIETSIDYQHAMERAGEFLTVSYRYAGNPTMNDNLMTAKYLSPTSQSVQQHLINKGNLHEHTGQIDYVRPINDMHTIETGLKYIARLGNTDPTYLFRMGEDGEWMSGGLFDRQTATSGAMRYRQQIFGAYASYALRAGAFGFKTGVRGEYGFNAVSYPESPSSNFKNRFLDWEPEVNLSYNFSPAQQLSLAYRFNVVRPNITQLNPTRNQSATQYFQYGNPNLENEQRHSATLSFSTFSNRFMLQSSLIGQICNNAISSYTFLDPKDPKIIYSTWGNIGRNWSTMLTLYTSYMPTLWLRLMGGGMYGYYSFKSFGKTNSADNLYAWQNGSWGGQLWAQAMLTLPKSWSATLSGGYVMQAATLNMDSFDLWWNNINVSKKFLKDRLSVGAYVSNPITPVMRLNIREQGPNYHSLVKFSRNNFSVGINISYSFGQMKQNVSKTQRTIVNDDLSTSGGDATGQGGGAVGGVK